MSDFSDLDALVEKCDYNTKLAVTAWVFKHILDHAKEGGSYRYLIYDRLGFGMDSYAPLYMAGGMDISNEFDMERTEDIKKIVRENNLDVLKPRLGLCDEPGCFEEISCGTPIEGGYRSTCYEHMPKIIDEKIR